MIAPRNARTRVSPLKSGSGIVRTVEGRLCVRNRVYARVFDRGWIRDNMPHQELRRQKAAYRKGIMLTALVTILPILGLVLYSTFERRSEAEEYARQDALLMVRLAADRQDELLETTRKLLARFNLVEFGFAP